MPVATTTASATVRLTGIGSGRVMSLTKHSNGTQATSGMLSQQLALPLAVALAVPVIAPEPVVRVQLELER